MEKALQNIGRGGQKKVLVYAFAEFQATTRGTATQTIKALEAGGYLVRQRLESDGRSVSLQPTDKGREVLARDPFEVLARAVAALGSLVPNKGIIVKTRRALISFGEGLSSDELKYLARVLKRSLAVSR